MTGAPRPSPAPLTLPERCRLLGGASMWRTHAVDRVGIPALKMSDGPNGVRGEALGASATPGVAIPVGIALGATWDPALVGELGRLLGREARRRAVHVLLAPTVNLQRVPVGGRVFECFSEDPELTARLAVAYVRGVQSEGVAATVKHFAANDTEVDRFTVDVRVDERTLRELYLRPFEAAVREGGAWAVMSAYNRLDGEHCAANRRLLTDILRTEWGFDGVVVSDWLGAHDTVASARAGLNIPMPGPDTIYGPRLERAVEAGEVPGAAVNALVADVLTLIDRVGAADRPAGAPERTVDDPDERALCRRAVAAGAVLVTNTGVLPLAPDATVAVVGPNAADTTIMGGGSSGLRPLRRVSVLEGLTGRVAAVVHEPGVRINRMPPPVPERCLRTPDGRPGLRVDYRNGHDPGGPPVVSEVSPTSMLRFFGSTPAGVDPHRFGVTVSGFFVPEVDGPHRISAVITGAGRVRVGDVVVLDDPDRTLPRGPMFFGQGCAERTAVVDCRAGEPVEVEVRTTGAGGFAGLRLGVQPPDPPDLLERAVEAARRADAAVVVVGTNDEWETEGADRDTIGLPGDQDELIRRVAAVNPATVVVVNAGSPVAMPWVDEVAAVLVTWFGGQEMGHGVADVLVGAADPGGRLPVTFPRRLEDTPAWAHYAPVDGVQTYGEGLLVGYRGFDAAGTEPLFPFGHGLSYGDAEWVYPALSATTVPPGRPVEASVTVRGTGTRPATVVVQVYLAAVDPPVPRAPKELAAFAKVVVAPGETRRCRIPIPPEAFRRWDTATGTWRTDPGRWDVLLAASATDIRHRLPLEIRPT